MAEQAKLDYDVIIIGAGITGAGLFRDLALHGQKVLLVDKGDFTSQTSQSSSKMLHGGIRYLENFDFKLVWEALHEKNLWTKIAPHLCYESEFLLPIYKGAKRPLWMIKIGLFLYDLLSNFSNSPHKILNKSQTLSKIPDLKKENLRGSGLYYDAIMDDAKITLECIYDGLLENGCEALNYHEAISFKHFENYNEVTIRDTLKDSSKTYKAKEVIFALGPFTDKVLHNLLPIWHDILVPSKGIHIWLKAESINLHSPLLLQAQGNRVIFVIPRNNAILVGTTETQVNEEMFDIKAHDDEIEYLLDQLKDYFPEFSGDKSEVLSSFAGIRPLVKDSDTTDLGKTAREHKVFQPFSNTYVIAGGKYTTFRVMGQEITRDILSKSEIKYNCNKTRRPLRVKSTIASFPIPTITLEMVLKSIKTEKVRTMDDLIRRRIGINGKNHWPGGSEEFDKFFSTNKQIIESEMI